MRVLGLDRSRRSIAFVLFALSVHSFQTRYPRIHETKRVDFGRIGSRSLQSSEKPDVSKDRDSNNDEVSRLKNEAARIRLEAEKMDWELTLSKIKALESTIVKLKKPKEGETNNNIDDTIKKLDEQIRLLKQKLGKEVQSVANRTVDKALSETFEISMDEHGAGKFVATATTLGKTETPLVITMDKQDGVMLSSAGNVLASTDASSILLPMGKQKQVTAAATKTLLPTNVAPGKEDEALCGFDKADLNLYIPVALNLEATMPNATADERLEAFRASPDLQVNFKQKLTDLLIEPIQEMNRLQELRQQYLDSSSSKEKEMLKRQIDAITVSIEEDGPFTYSDSVYREIPELTIEALEARLSAVSALPEILQTLYKKRYNLESDANLTLAVLLDHYEMQLQLLEQVKEIVPLTSEVRSQVIRALESLPAIVRDHVAMVVGLEKESYTLHDLVMELSKTEEDDDIDWGVEWNPWNQIVAATTPSLSKTSLTGVDWTALDVPDNDDIEMVDRSRYVYDFYPSIARMNYGRNRILKETAEKFALSVLDKKVFMVTNKVEHVVGGYYVRGRNLIDGDTSGVLLMASVEKSLSRAKDLFGKDEKFEYFYIYDPAPLTDEEVELEYRNDPLFVLTGKNATAFYNFASPLTKASVSTLALASLALFSVSALGLNQLFLDQFEVAMGLSSIQNEEINVSLLFGNIVQVVTPLLGLQLAHEIGHRLVAWRDKVRSLYYGVGLTLITLLLLTLLLFVVSLT